MTDRGDAHRADMRERMAIKRAAERNIELPPIVDMKRRAACLKSLAKFCRTYFPDIFCKPWSKNHRACIKKMEYAIRNGGQFCLALPRGEGKTVLSQAAALWAVLNGHRLYPVLIGATEPKAEKLLKDIKGMIRFSVLLEEDFPELCLPIKALENNAKRCAQQTASVSLELAKQLKKANKLKELPDTKPRNTEMNWTSKLVVLPTVSGSRFSNAVIEIGGITGDIRGRHMMTTTGVVLRPDLAVCDDPQTADSAKSAKQCKDREDIINADVLGLPGPGEKITCFMPCTVIHHDDLASRFLDHERNPDWQGERHGMIISWPVNMELWETYNKVRLKGIRAEDKGKQARGFYRKHKAELERGGKVSWTNRKSPDDLSALQHAMDLYFRLGERAFASEYQNEPVADHQSCYVLDEETVQNQAMALPWRNVPLQADYLTVMADVNAYGLHYTVLATSDNFTGWVVDYGKYPEGQKDVIWSEQNTRGLTEDQAIYEAIVNFGNMLNGIQYRLEGKTRCKQIDLLTVDCGWQMKTVFNAVAHLQRSLPFMVVASRGRAHKDYRETKVQGRPGDNCYRTVWESKGPVLVHNADSWRSRCQQAFLLTPGSPGSLALYGEANRHRTFAEHICAEILVEHMQGEKDEYYNWHKKPGVRNDLLDSTVGAMAAANILGASLHSPGAGSWHPNTTPQRQDASDEPQKPKKRIREATYSYP